MTKPAISQDVLDRVLGRTEDRPTRGDIDAVSLEGAGIVNLRNPIDLMVGRALAELIERRAGTWPDEGASCAKVMRLSKGRS